MHEARALVLDVAQRALRRQGPTRAWHTPGTVARVGERSLVAIVAFAHERFGVELPHPSGALPRADPREFVFVLPPGTRVDAADTLWVPMRDLDAKTPHADALWGSTSRRCSGGWQPPTRAVDVFGFGSRCARQRRLRASRGEGEKRATAAWTAAEQAQGNVIPAPGLVSIVTDGFGFPVCALETERVDHVRFADVTEDFAEAEGEGDGSLADWREGHLRYFEQQATEGGDGVR